MIISGATKGLGRALALQFGRAGYRVVGFFKSDEQAAARIREEFFTGGLQGEFINHDVTREDPDDVFEKVMSDQSGGLTLVNNACASFEPKPMHLLKWADFQQNLDVAVKGTLQCSQGVLRRMVGARCGTIVNVLTSALEGLPPKGFSAYVVAKAALQGLTKALAGEYSSRGVRVFSVSPGYLATSLTANWDPRLKASLLATGVEPQDPLEVADYVLGLVENPDVPGIGEDYLVPTHRTSAE